MNETMTHNIMTQAEIEAQFEDEWVLVEDPEFDANDTLLRGKVLWHSKSRDEVYRKDLELRPHSAAYLIQAQPRRTLQLTYDPFNAQKGLIIVHVTLYRPTGDRTTRLALDTGASSTLVSKEILITIGYDPNALPKTVNFTTGSGIESAARVTVAQLEALGQERPNFSVIAHTLPPSAAIDGVLGLDFLRNHILTLDFQNGKITLA